MATNKDIVTRALNKIGFGSGSIESQRLTDSFDELVDLMGALEANSTVIGFNWESTLNDETGFDRKFDSAISALLSERLAAVYRMPVDISLQKQISLANQTLARHSVQLNTWKRPNRMPRGSGNHGKPFIWDRYYTNTADSYTKLRSSTFNLELDNTTAVFQSVVRQSGDHTLSFAINGPVTDGRVKVEYRKPNLLAWVEVGTVQLTSLQELEISDSVDSYRLTITGYTGDPWTLTVKDKVRYREFQSSPQDQQAQ